jgi:hypothetical protein
VNAIQQALGASSQGLPISEPDVAAPVCCELLRKFPASGTVLAEAGLSFAI